MGAWDTTPKLRVGQMRLLFMFAMFVSATVEAQTYGYDVLAEGQRMMDRQLEEQQRDQEMRKLRHDFERAQRKQQQEIEDLQAQQWSQPHNTQKDFNAIGKGLADIVRAFQKR